MVRYLLLIFSFLLSGTLIYAQSSLSGKITDEETGEPIIFGNIAIFKNGNMITGNVTDFDGNYSFANIDPGTYDVEASYTGYQSKRIEGVVVNAGRAHKLDVELMTGITLTEIVVEGYKVPLIEQDNTTSGTTITSDQIKNLPTRNINALAATSAGAASADEGSAISIRGSRSNATNYYVDGMRIQGSLIPESEIDQMQVITGGIEAQYGDVTGGIISITTKGPSNRFSGGLELETSEFLDAYNNRLVGLSLSGPILKNKMGNSIIGYRLSGRYTYQLDDDPPATDIFRINDEKLAELEANPIIEIGGQPLVAADFTYNDDVNVMDYRPFEDNTRYDFTAKLDARLSSAIDVTATGAMTRSENQFTPGGWRVFNSHNNPTNNYNSYRGNFRFRHRLGGSSLSTAGTGEEEQAKKSSVIQNAAYTLQFSYENTGSDVSDPRHGDNYFDYGYVGKFDFDWVPTYSLEFAEDSEPFLRHTDYRQVLRGYTPGSVNPVLANYNNPFDINTTESGEPLNGQVGDAIIFFNNVADASTDISREDFYAPNGEISSLYTSNWYHANVGSVYNRVLKTNNDIYTFNVSSSFDLLPGGSEKGRHNIQFGILYEQRTNRRYNINPVELWDIARQQANSHIQGIPENADTIGVFPQLEIPGFPVFENIPLRELDIEEGEDARFYREIRKVTGDALNEFVNVDGLSPDDLRLDMFSAKEINDQRLLNYYGYDYLGNPFDGTFDDFFTATDADGVRTFPVAPDKPIYTSAFIQDKFTFKDIIFRLGLRVDRYDANTKVLKDNYSLYEIMNASDFHGDNPDQTRPSNIGDEYSVYLVEADASDIKAYRNEDQWYFANGNPANSPTQIFEGGLVFPKYADERANSVSNYIKSREFDPNASFKDYEAQVNFMPRLAFSFPISEEANFFAHYDILMQRPPSNAFASARNYFYFTDISYNENNPISNSNLKPERTIDYEVGFMQKLSNTSAIKITSYYKEMRDMIQRRTFFPVALVNQYTTYDNQDFGTVKGFSFQYDLRRTGNIMLMANYTLQFADGTGSDANSQRGLTSRGNIRTLFPLNFDERHRFNASIDYRYGSGKQYNGPRWFGADVFANAGLNLQIIAVSGRPYTAKIEPEEFGGTGTVGAINGSRKPWNFTTNLRIDKSFKLSNKVGVNVYLRVSNLLDQRNVIDVYAASGSPTDDGYLASDRGENQMLGISGSLRNVDAFLASYQWRLVNPNQFSLPRRMFVGASFNF